MRRARTVLEQGAADSDPDVRREVAVALGLPSRRDPSTSLLEKLAADKDHLVREAALVSIGELRDPRLVKPAHDALEDEVPEVAFAAARTLFKLDQAQLQRGFKIYKEVCANCHSIEMLTFRNLGEPGGPGFSEGQVETVAAEYKVRDLDEQGNVATSGTRRS